MAASGYITVNDAARRLGVSPQRVRVWIADGRLPAAQLGRSYAIDSADLARISREPRDQGRRLSGRNAWGLLAMLSRLPVEGVAQRSLFRLHALVRGPLEGLVKGLRHSQPRSEVHAWRVLPTDLERLADDRRLVRSGLSANAPEIDIRYDMARDGIDAYISRDELERLRNKLQPVENAQQPNLYLRVPLHALWILDREVSPLPVVAADLMNHDDPRVRRAAEDALKGSRGD